MTRRKLFQMLAGLPLVGRLVPEPISDLELRLEALKNASNHRFDLLKSNDPTVEYCRAIFNKPFNDQT